MHYEELEIKNQKDRIKNWGKAWMGLSVEGDGEKASSIPVFPTNDSAKQKLITIKPLNEESTTN